MDEHLWWQRGTIYQIYPRSFMDSNGDGIGDLPGILSRLDYLKWLGVDAVWLSPIFPSPMADFGYDVSDYTGIEPMFGTMADFDRLLDAVHQRGMKLLLDLVPNHTSNEHAWFQESRSSRDNPRREWYIWRDAVDGGPPNNWPSAFGGSAWQWDEATGQYYLHSFAVEQPDLNWRNPAVEAAVFDAIRFWLDKGVDGFRVDVIFFMIKDALYRDNPPNPAYREGEDPGNRYLPIYNFDQPEVHDLIRRMRQVFDSYDDRVMIGEIYLPYEKLMLYYGAQNDESHLPFNFQLILLPWQADVIRGAVNNYESLLPPGGWPNWVLGNHDQYRIASRIGREQARVANMLLFTLRGTPTAYYGDELAMVNVAVPPEMAHDPQEKGNPGTGRDPQRTPMQWDASPKGGFTTGDPWLPLAPDSATYNVEAERDDPNSMLTLVYALLELRRNTPALSVGSYADVATDTPDILSFTRRHGDDTLVIVLNLSHEPRSFSIPGATETTLLLSTLPGRSGTVDLTDLDLAGDEGIIVRL